MRAGARAWTGRVTGEPGRNVDDAPGVWRIFSRTHRGLRAAGPVKCRRPQPHVSGAHAACVRRGNEAADHEPMRFEIDPIRRSEAEARSAFPARKTRRCDLIRSAALVSWLIIPVLLPAGAGAQATSTGVRTTMAGVYTAPQAAKGEEVFASLCTGCHTVGSHSGPAFMNNWRGYPLSELFGYMRAQMPKADPGSLTAVQYVQLIAYILKLNGMPAGETELPVDSATLGRITIDTTKATPDARVSDPTLREPAAGSGR